MAAKLEHSAHWKEAQKFWKGEKDAEYRRTLHASVAEWTEALKTLPKTAPALSRLACQTVIHSLHASLPHVGETFDSKVLVSEAEVIAAEHPCYGTLRLAQNAHLTAML